MIKKLVQHGNSFALLIDKPILELLNIDSETNLEIKTDGINLIITPKVSIQPLESKKLKASLKKINLKHSKTLQKLAK
ncbi:MAG: AbrB/MazE/SpoVT family DNA-binding domain-containing protein [Leptospiraceae bacterium]|nr:AbrB/MazE/SpoVT family DNA-binding domain-containing protein [Leptospiraceae bacterium]